MERKVYLVCKEFESNSCFLSDQIKATILSLASHSNYSWTFLVDQFINSTSNASSVLDCLGANWIKEHIPKNSSIRHIDANDFISDVIDLVVCLGGDGTLLNAVFRFQNNVPPILSFNFGTLGFLTHFSFPEHQQIFNDYINAQLPYLERARLKCTVHKNSQKSTLVYHALNEIVIERGPSPFLIHVEVYVNNCFVTLVNGDGIIIATSTGSTAYSMSAGGCLVHPLVSCILFTPLCPHSLTLRPLVLPASMRLRLKLASHSRASAWISCDSRVKLEITKEDYVEVELSNVTVKCFVPQLQTDLWLRSLAHCLNWNAIKIQGVQ